jgi:cytochrome c oxidase subunit 1
MPRPLRGLSGRVLGWNEVSSWGSYLSGISVLVFLYGIFEAHSRKRLAGDNPWGEGATTFGMAAAFAAAVPPMEHCRASR